MGGDRATKSRRLSRDDWAEAALTALGEGGLGAIAVEPLAVRLGATKGSFYWHFRNRDALVEAALERWADRDTEGLIRRFAARSADPGEQLTLLFDAVLRDGQVSRAELALLANADDPLVRPVLARVAERRVAYIESRYAALGCPEQEARHRAVLAYTAHLGLVQGQVATGGRLLPDADRPAYLDFLYRAIGVSRADRPPRT